MAVTWGSAVKVGLQVAGALVPQIGVIESIAKAVPGLKGSAKEDAALSLAKDVLVAAGNAEQLVNDPEVEAAMRSFIQAYVALQNVVNTKPAAASK